MNQVGDTVVITAHLHKDLIGLRGKVVLVIYGGYVGVRLEAPYPFKYYTSDGIAICLNNEIEVVKPSPPIISI